MPYKNGKNRGNEINPYIFTGKERTCVVDF